MKHSDLYHFVQLSFISVFSADQCWLQTLFLDQELESIWKQSIYSVDHSFWTLIYSVSHNGCHTWYNWGSCDHSLLGWYLVCGWIFLSHCCCWAAWSGTPDKKYYLFVCWNILSTYLSHELSVHGTERDDSCCSAGQSHQQMSGGGGQGDTHCTALQTNEEKLILIDWEIILICSVSNSFFTCKLRNNRQGFLF